MISSKRDRTSSRTMLSTVIDGLYPRTARLGCLARSFRGKRPMDALTLARFSTSVRKGASLPTPKIGPRTGTARAMRETRSG